MDLFGALITGAVFGAGMVTGIYIADKHGVTCEDVRKLSDQLTGGRRVARTAVPASTFSQHN